MDNILAVVEHSYDYQNRWVRRSFDDDGPGSNDPVDTLWVYDGWQQALEFVNTNTLSDAGPGDLAHVYFWATPLTDYLLADEIKDGTQTSDDVRWSFADHLGTPRIIIAHLSGWDYAFNERTYDAFGNLLSESDPAYGTSIGFTGKMFDITTGFGYHINRWYDAAVGRWVSEDPIVFLGGDTNLARWVANQVTTQIDPDGLERLPTAAQLRNEMAGDPWVGDTVQQMNTSYAEGQVIAEDAQSLFGSMMPGVGNVIAGAQAWFGYDMHGRKMSTADRLEAGFDVLGAALPAGMLGKVGRAARRAPLPSARNLNNVTGGRNVGNLVRMPSSSAMMRNPPTPPALPQTICPPQNPPYPKSPTGKGTVPPSQRDPKRVWTKAENERKLAAQGGECAACEKPTNLSDARGHHRERHADGGQTTDANHDILCVDCHREVHRP